MGGKNNTNNEEMTEEDYIRLLALYQELNREFDKLSLELKIFHKGLRKEVDGVKMKKILKDIINIKDQ